MKQIIRNIKFSLEQWKFYKGQMLFLALQVVISFLLLCYMFHNFYTFQQLNRQIRNLMSGKEIFKLCDGNDESWNMELADSKHNDKFLKLLSSFEAVEEDVLVINNSYCTYLNEEDIDIVEVTADFFEKYNLQGDYDSKEIREKFLVNYTTLEDEDNTIKPVIAGAFFEKEYDLGDTITDEFGLKYQIIGFLKKGETYSMPTQSKDLLLLDKALVTPVYVNITDNDEIMEYMFSCLFITDDRQKLSIIEDTNYELRLLDSYFISYSNQLKIVEQDTKEGLLLFGSFGVLLFIFSIIGIVGMLIQFLEEYAYEYGVNMLCGADIYDIFIRLIFQITVCIWLGLGITLIVFGMGKAFINILELAAISLCFLYVYSFRKLKFHSILSSLRSRQ